MSSIFQLNWTDLGKSLWIIIGSPFVLALLQALYSWTMGGMFPTWVDILGWAKVSVAGGIAYLIKNFFTNSQNELMKPESK